LASCGPLRIPSAPALAQRREPGEYWSHPVSPLYLALCIYLAALALFVGWWARFPR